MCPEFILELFCDYSIIKRDWVPIENLSVRIFTLVVVRIVRPSYTCMGSDTGDTSSVSSSEVLSSGTFLCRVCRF